MSDPGGVRIVAVELGAKGFEGGVGIEGHAASAEPLSRWVHEEHEADGVALVEVRTGLPQPVP